MSATIKHYLFVFIILLFNLSMTGKMSDNSKTYPRNSSEKMKISGILVEKDFILKNGEKYGTELYFRASIQDYFIKFCEKSSSITKEQLESFIDKPITVEATIRNGMWDVCEINLYEEPQSRIGEYMIIHRLF